VSYWKWAVTTPDEHQPRRFVHLSSALGYAAERARALTPGLVSLVELGGWAELVLSWNGSPEVAGRYTHQQREAALAAFGMGGARDG